MLRRIHSRAGLQRVIGFLVGIMFGFLLQKGGVTQYDVIIGQLLLVDFTVVKIMVTAIITGGLLVHMMRSFGWVELHPKAGSLGSSALGGFIFGIGFGILGYCPGTVAGAIGQGPLDALFGRLGGILLGTGLYAEIYPKIENSILGRGNFGTGTMRDVTQVIEAGAAYWQALRSFATAKRFLLPDDVSPLTIACTVPKRLPTEIQAARLLTLKQRCEAEGFQHD